MKPICTLVLCLFLFSTAQSQLVISQVYGAGGNASATYNADFIELFNPTTGPLSTSGHSIQYASAAGTSWQKFDLPTVTLAGGQYFLIQASGIGATGIALPTPDATAAPVINMSGTAGKVALVNSTTALSGTQCPPPFMASIVDYVGFGTTANCFEGTGPTPAPGNNANSFQRVANGCTDNNNNATDFIAAVAIARNTASPLSPCAAPLPTLIAGPDITNITTSAGTASAPQSFNLSGFSLTGFPGNITVTASASLEVSLTSGAGFATSINVPYTTAALSATIIYVRISATAPQGAVTGTVTSSGGGAAANAVVNVTGGVYQNYYNTKANLGLTNTGTWSTTVNGAGPSPANFTSGYQLFNIINQTNANYTGVWNVTGTGNSSRVVVGDGTAPMTFTIVPGIDSVTSATRVDVLNNATLVIQNNRRPFLNNLATGSTVDFAQTGVTADDTIRVPAISYHHLRLTNGLKYFSANTTTVRGDFTATNVFSINGSSPTFSTLNAFGNVTFTNSFFEPNPSGDNARITLAMNGSAAQSLISNSTMNLFRLQRDTTSSNGIINAQGLIILGNSAGGGLRLNQGTSTTTVLNLTTITTAVTFTGGAVVTVSALGKISTNGGSVNIMKSSGNSHAGTLRFTAGSLLSLLNIEFDPAFARDSVFIADNVNVQTLNLNKGKVIVNTDAIVNVTDGPLLSGGHIIGGSVTAFVEGKLRRSGLFTPGDYIYPVGKGNKYAPVTIEVINGDYTVQYFFNGYGNYLIDPATLATYPGYQVSSLEYWNIEQNAPPLANPAITFFYTDALTGVLDPVQVKIAHFDGTDWNDVGGTAAPGNTLINGSVTVTNVTAFGPFTFSGRTLGVIPVKLISFDAQKINNTVKFNWRTSQEINSREFIVERSANGNSWVAIATIPAAGNSNSIRNYTTTDFNPVKGVNLYRIRQVDINNRIDYSGIRSVLFNTPSAVVVSPNPATDMLNVYLDNNGRKIQVGVLDITGKVIRNLETNETNVNINTTSWASGIYYLRVVDGTNVSTVKVVLK